MTNSSRVARFVAASSLLPLTTNSSINATYEDNNLQCELTFGRIRTSVKAKSSNVIEAIKGRAPSRKGKYTLQSIEPVKVPSAEAKVAESSVKIAAAKNLAPKTGITRTRPSSFFSSRRSDSCPSVFTNCPSVANPGSITRPQPPPRHHPEKSRVEEIRTLYKSHVSDNTFDTKVLVTLQSKNLCAYFNMEDAKIVHNRVFPQTPAAARMAELEKSIADFEKNAKINV